MCLPLCIIYHLKYGFTELVDLMQYLTKIRQDRVDKVQNNWWESSLLLHILYTKKRSYTLCINSIKVIQGR